LVDLASRERVIRMKKASALLAVTALAALGLGACGGDDDEDETTAASTPTQTATAPAAGGSTVAISTPPGSDLAFNETNVTAKPGPVTINFENAQALQHDVVVEDASGNELGGTDLVSSGSAEATVELQPGTFTFYCDVPGHREGGMEGTLTVK
jgi:plastocyanin